MTAEDAIKDQDIREQWEREHLLLDEYKTSDRHYSFEEWVRYIWMPGYALRYLETKQKGVQK